jgi:hypothetical protein
MRLLLDTEEIKLFDPAEGKALSAAQPAAA